MNASDDLRGQIEVKNPSAVNCKDTPGPQCHLCRNHLKAVSGFWNSHYFEHVMDQASLPINAQIRLIVCLDL